MKRPKSILLDYDLFVDLYVYACMHSEPDDLQFKRLYAGVRQKLEAMTRHDMYSLYKSGANEEIRGKARQDYLNAVGLLDSFQWPPEQDVNVTHKKMISVDTTREPHDGGSLSSYIVTIFPH